MDFSFNMPVKLIAEKSAVKANSNIFSQFGKNALIVTGGSSAKRCGALDDVIEALEKNGIEYQVFDKITQNPQASVCCEAGQLARDFNIDFVIGIGGGSPLDAAKAIAFYAANKTLEAQDIYNYDISLSPLPLILIGTTAGTGSEVSGVSVLTQDDGRKKSVGGNNFYANLSFCDPKYTYSAPYEITVSTALDALAHAVEGWFSPKFDIISKIFAEKAIPTIWKALQHFYETKELPSEEMRDELYYASIFSGMTLNTCGTAFPHGMGYALTEDFNVPHGKACSVFMPALVRRGLEIKPDSARELLNLIGTNYLEFEKIISDLTDLKDIKITEEKINTYCERWVNLKNFNNSPGGFSVDQAKKLLLELF